MIRSATAIALTFAASAAMAQMSPVGLWQTIDDKDGTPKSEIRIVENAGVVSGKIERDLNPKAKPEDTCIECKDDRKNQPIIGLELIRGLKKAEGKDMWEGGTIVEPSSGKVYKMTMTPIEGGKKIEMRGYIGPFYRTQIWNRIQ
jgi:uncharacterized protein (DUF2147 family)